MVLAISAYGISSMKRRTISSRASIPFRLNGEGCVVSFAPHKTLLEVLREDLGLMGRIARRDFKYLKNDEIDAIHAYLAERAQRLH